MKSIYKEVRAMSEVVEGLQQGFQDIAFAGDGQRSSVTGLTFAPDTNDYIWATVQAASNTTLANGSAGIPHAWTQIVPQANGNTGTGPTTLSGTVNSNPAYGTNGDFLTTNTTTKLYPVVTFFDNSSNTTQTQWWFESPGSNGAMEPCRPVTGLNTVDGIVYYAAYTMTRSLTNGVRINNQAIWLYQWHDLPLTIGVDIGPDTGGVYMSKHVGTKTVGDVTRDVYMTTEFPCLDGDCNVVN